MNSLVQYGASDEEDSPSADVKRRRVTHGNSSDEEYGLVHLSRAEKNEIKMKRKLISNKHTNETIDSEDDVKTRFSDDEKWHSPPKDVESRGNTNLEPPPPPPGSMMHSPSNSPMSSNTNTPIKLRKGMRPVSSLTIFGKNINDEPSSSLQVRDDSISENLNKRGDERETSFKSMEQRYERAEQNADEITNKRKSREEIEEEDRKEKLLLEEAYESIKQSEKGHETPQSHRSDSPSHQDDEEQVSEEVTLPPEASEPCDPELLARFDRYFEQKSRGFDFNNAVQGRKDFRNPSMYKKLIEHFNIDEMGTNFSKDVYDPQGFKPTDYYNKLADLQRVVMERLEKEKKHTATANPTVSASRSRTKWENKK